MAIPVTTSATAYSVVTAGCGVLDRSGSGKLALTGDQAREFLAGQVSNDTESVQPGTGCYAALLDNKGKMHGDLRVIHTPDGAELLLLCERVALQALFDALRRSIIGWRAELHKRTVQQGLLSLLGPTARTVAGAPDLLQVEHASAFATIGGHEVLLVATDLGLDVVCPADAHDEVLAELLQRGAVAIDESTAELRRIETGRPRYGVDLDASVIPQEADLNERAVSFTKGCYVGQETVARLFYRGKPNRHLRGLLLDTPVAVGAELHGPPKEDGTPSRVLGTVTSTALSPVHGPIALALVRREAEVGDTVTVGPDATAQVVELPFAAPDAA
ncbi:MAG: folate-binding protein YgfZ [Solirubrobacterales bacterium]|nr:folate-binding protein YgfZ [Solirubrobacterales bacterium]